MIVRSPVADMRPMGRNTAGVHIINLKEEDVLVGAEIVDASDLELVNGETQRIQIDPAEETAAMAEKAEPEPEEEGEAEEDEEFDADEGESEK